MKCQTQTINLFHFKINLSLFMCALFYSSFVCISAYANVYFKTTIIKQNIKTVLIVGVPSSQALLGFYITAPPSVCVPDVIGVLAVWIQQKKGLTNQKPKTRRDGITNQKPKTKTRRSPIFTPHRRCPDTNLHYIKLIKHLLFHVLQHYV